MTKAIVKMFKVSNDFMINQCYLIYKNNIGILIDPAWDYDLLNDFLIQNNIKLKAVLLTHSHVDHTNLAEKFSKEYEVPVFMSTIEIDSYNFQMINLKKVDHLKELKIDTFTINPLITPGHTEGSTCYLIEGNLFSGDTIFIEGVGICDNNNAEKLYNSVQFIKEYIPQHTLCWPGHSFGETPGKEFRFLLKNNIYFQFESKEYFISFRTRKNKPDPFLFK